MASPAPEVATSASPEGGRCGLIYFNKWDPTSRQLATFSVRPTGDDLTRLTPGKKHTTTVAVSPDARYMIASRYERETDTYRLVKTSTVGGSWKRLSPKDGESYADVAISPTGRFVAFARAKSYSRTDLYVMDVRTREMTLVYEDAQSGRWAGSDEKLIFSASAGELGDHNLDLFTVDRDGSDLMQLTSTTEADEMTGGIYSPDGKKILFERYPQNQQNEFDGPYADVWVMDADGSDERQLTERQDFLNGVENPQWSPTGERISYEFVNDGFRAVLTSRPSGSDANLVTERGYGSTNAVFSPNGQKVIINVYSGKGNGILIAQADGSHERWFMRSSRYEDGVVAWPSC